MTIDVSLSPSSILKAIDGLKKYKKDIVRRTDNARNEVAELGKQIYIEEAQIAIGSNRAANVTQVVDGINETKIVANDPVLVYNEYGTGIVGASSPHPKSGFVGWSYDVNNHGEAGWKYPKEDGTFGWTRGLPARRPMLTTSDRLKQGEASEAAKRGWNK